ncbi:MAG: hypothetical protein NC402_06685 [Prevotella sp.]|nr:hypothetical protein [Prevotella sp.]MCM1075423.1 hypothetical protein [Ruminococcus sp.]
MKKYIHAAWLVIVVIFATIGISSCTKDEPEQNMEQKKDAITRISNSGQAIAFKCNKWVVYHRDERTNWKDVNIMGKGYYGLEPILPDLIVFKEGKIMVPLKTFTLANGPHRLIQPWSIYCKLTGTPTTLYLANAALYDEGKKLKVGDCYCDVKKISDNELVLIRESPYWYADPMNPGFGKPMKDGISTEVDTYQRIDTEDIDFSKYLCYETERELVVDVIAKMRAYFGESLDLNKYLAPNIILDEPIINFDDLERYLLQDLANKGL